MTDPFRSPRPGAGRGACSPTTFRKGIDPDLAWDSDGHCWVHSSAFHIFRTRIDEATGTALGAPQTTWSATGLQHPEAPHLFERDGPEPPPSEYVNVVTNRIFRAAKLCNGTSDGPARAAVRAGADRGQR